MQERRTYDENILKLVGSVEGLHAKLDGLKDEFIRQSIRTEQEIRDVKASAEIRDERITSLRNKVASFGAVVTAIWGAIELYFHIK